MRRRREQRRVNKEPNASADTYDDCTTVNYNALMSLLHSMLTGDRTTTTTLEEYIACNVHPPFHHVRARIDDDQCTITTSIDSTVHVSVKPAHVPFSEWTTDLHVMHCMEA